jgi:hypothetical protein
MLLDEYIQSELENSARIQSEAMSDARRIEQRKGPGYLQHLGGARARATAARGYRNALHELREALLAGDVELPTDPEGKLHRLARDVVAMWRAGSSMHDLEEMQDAIGKLADALPPKPHAPVKPDETCALCGLPLEYHWVGSCPDVADE